MRNSLYIEASRNGDGPVCPRCDAQIVIYANGWFCSICEFDSSEWEQAIEVER